MPWWRRSSHSDDRAGVSLEGGRASVVAIRRSASGPVLRGRASETLPEGGLDARMLDRLAERAGARGMSTHLVLVEDDYQLQMIEAPRVESSELKAAVRWKVKDLIDFHIDDAVFDAFAIPGKSDSPQARDMMYAVVSRRRRIAELVQAFHRSDLELEAIDIPELALRNLARLDDADARGMVTLHLGAGSGLVILTRQGELYISRRLGANAASGADPSNYDDILLEIQRSMDFYTSHFGQPRPAALGVVPGFAGDERIVDWMAGQLDFDVRLLEPGSLLEARPGLDADLDASQMVALGGALRTEDVRL
ncbi:MAG: hypothetical protein R3323_01760 [Wenzhouxiangellaceae bacterium]|nr:hypothetical protein [Wenzhouxiangellaceae bacterium]